MQSKEHWEKVYETKAEDSVSWIQEHARQSVEFIAHTRVAKESSIIDVGGGASTLVDDLLAIGYQHARSWTCRRPHRLHRRRGSASEHPA